MSEEKKLQTEELDQVTGGRIEANGGYFRCTNPNCWRHNSKFTVGTDECVDCGWPMEWVER